MKAGYNNTDIGVIPEDWEINTYGKVFDFLSTISNSRSELSFKGDFDYIHYGDIHVRWTNTLDLNKHELPKIKREKIKNLPAAIKDGDLVMADASEDYEGIAKTIEVKNVGQKVIFSGLHTFLMRDRNNYFVDGLRGYLHEIPVVKQQIHKVATGLKVFGVSKNTLKNIVIPIPKPEEQKAILAALSDTDGLIESLEKFIHKKRDMKTATMQQLLTGKKRLPGFKEDWNIKKLGDCLAYEQPSKYIVRSTEYLKNGIIAVLTANKSFILGYTSEDFGIFNNTPVIIFDDFTTDSKFVDFPFKVKSSALKILKLKNNNEANIRYLFERMQIINFNISDHKRYWISEYQKIELRFTMFTRTSAIADRIMAEINAK